LIVAHIAGVPVEETLLALAPVGVAGVGVWFAQLAHRARKIRLGRVLSRSSPGGSGSQG
jgi:hypothetical protein